MGSGGPGSQYDTKATGGYKEGFKKYKNPNRKPINGLKPKDLCIIPARVALALQADGWWLRSDIIWNKPNPMPESVTDRPAKSHEYLFLLTKKPKYFYDAEAVREPQKDAHLVSDNYGKLAEHNTFSSKEGNRSVVFGTKWQPKTRAYNPSGRNLRSVWHLATCPTRYAHYATFPPKLVEPCIKAGTSEKGVCPACGSPWARELDVNYVKNRPSAGNDKRSRAEDNFAKANDTHGFRGNNLLRDTRTTGWRPTCTCDTVDRRLILTPTGTKAGDDPSLVTGRAGMNRPRGDGEGQRPITRYEQQEYAKQLKAAPCRDAMEAEAGKGTFAHYIRTDESGARPVPEELLDQWISRKWIERVVVPECVAPEPIPATVLDPFSGTATTGVVALELGRSYIGIELNPKDAEHSRKRLAGVMPLFSGGYGDKGESDAQI